MHLLRGLPYSILVSIFIAIGVVLLYYGVLILKPSIYLLIGLFFGGYYLYVRYKHTYDTRADRVMTVSLSILLAMMVSSFIYTKWSFTDYVSAESVLKFSTVLFSFFASYVNFVYYRAKYSYKRKKGNQRLREQPENIFTKPFKKDAVYEKDDIVITLGRSAEREDNPN